MQNLSTQQNQPFLISLFFFLLAVPVIRGSGWWSFGWKRFYCIYFIQPWSSPENTLVYRSSNKISSSFFFLFFFFLSPIYHLTCVVTIRTYLLSSYVHILRLIAVLIKATCTSLLSASLTMQMKLPGGRSNAHTDNVDGAHSNSCRRFIKWVLL